MSALSGFKVVEIGDDSGAYAGKLLAELGADVVRLSFRSAMIPRMNIDTNPHVQAFLNRSKRIVEVTESSLKAVESIVAEADVLLESGPSDILERVGLVDSSPAIARRDLVRTRVTPFGAEDPRANDPATDLTVSASAGFLFLGGWPDRPPTRAYGDQSWRMASLYAAVGTLLALYERCESGCGQTVDVSAEEAVASALENALQFFDLEGVVRRRSGAGYNEAGSGVYACQDGYVYLMVGRLSTAVGWQNLMAWLAESNSEGHELLSGDEWSDFDYRKRQDSQAAFRRVFEGFAASWTKTQLYVEAQQRGIPMTPINAVLDLLSNEHLQARGFFERLSEHLTVGAPYRLSRTPWQARVPTRELWSS